MIHADINVAKAENVLFPLISVLGFLTNAFVILVIVVSEKWRSNRTVANTFVLNLAIADILFLLTLPFYTPSLHVNGYPYTEGMCKFLEAMKHVSYHASILFLTGMSFDRYIAIVHSLRSLQYRTQRNARIACAVLWLTSFVVSIPIVAFSSLDVRISTFTNDSGTCRQMFPGYESQYASDEELLDKIGIDDYDYHLYEYSGGGNGSEEYSEGYGDYGNDYNHTGPEFSAQTANRTFVCIDRGHENSTSFRAWQWLTFILFFVLPVLIVMFCYFKIWRATAIRTVRSQRAEGNQEQESLQNPQMPPKQSWKQLQSKVTIMVAILVSGFIVCWMPFQIWIILTLAPGHQVSYAHKCDVINSVVTVLAWSNSVLNPILYSVTSENFRKRAMTTLLFLRYGSRSTMRMSMARTSRTGIGMKTERTDIQSTAAPVASSPKYNRRFDTMQQTSPPPTPKNETVTSLAF